MSPSRSSRAPRVARLAVVAFLALVAGNCGDDPADPPPDIIAAPAQLTAVVAGTDIALSWISYDDAPVRVLRRLEIEPEGPRDTTATLVFEGEGQRAFDPLAGLDPPPAADSLLVYHYAVFGCGPDGSCENTGSRATCSPTLVQCLHAGGYTVYWRHAAADSCRDRLELGTAATTSVPGWWRDCRIDCDSTDARQLDPTGILQATQIGDAVAIRGIPFGRALSSEFCRCVQTAQNMNLLASIELDPGLTFFVYDEPGRCQAARTRIAQPPAAGSNTAIIGHAGFTCGVLGSLAWGEAAIYKPDGAGGARFIARVHSDAWLALP